MPKRINIPCRFSKENTISSNLVPVKITVLHSGINRNNTNIELDVIKRAIPTIYNKPILAYIRTNYEGNPDFAGHEVDIAIDEHGEIKYKYYEYPVGIIPESAKVEFYEENGKTYLTCMGYIYKDYSNETLDILSETNGKCVSVELYIHGSEEMEGDKNDILNITSFSFLGVTILSDEYTPAMDENCRIDFIRDTEVYSEFINKAKEDVVKFELNQDQNKNNENLKNESDVKNEDSTLNEDTEDVVTVKVDENITIDFSIFNEFFGKEVENEIELKILFREKINLLNSVISEKETKINELEEKIAQYQKVERENSVNEILEEIGYSLDENDVKEVVLKANNFEIDLKEFKREIYAIIGEKMSKNKNTKRYSMENILFVGNNNIATQTGKSEYSDLFDGIF